MKYSHKQLSEYCQEVQKILDNVEYKPGSLFDTSISSIADAIVLRIVVPCISSFEHSKIIPITHSMMIPVDELEYVQMYLEKFILYHIYSMIQRLEIHEIQEFLKYKDNYYNHPHPIEDR